MVRIAICDDEAVFINLITTKLNHWFSEHHTENNLSVFTSPKDLLYEVEEETIFDVVFLDIEMPGKQGLSVAADIRRFLPECLIVFVSSHTQYVFDAFRIPAFRFIPKKLLDEKLEEALAALLLQLTIRDSGYLITESKRLLSRVPYASIIRIGQQIQYAQLFLTDGSTELIRKSLRTLCKEFTDNRFIRINRNWVCNADHIRRIENSVITMDDGFTIQIPHGRYDELFSLLINTIRERQGTP